MFLKCEFVYVLDVLPFPNQNLVLPTYSRICNLFQHAVFSSIYIISQAKRASSSQQTSRASSAPYASLVVQMMDKSIWTAFVAFQFSRSVWLLDAKNQNNQTMHGSTAGSPHRPCCHVEQAIGLQHGATIAELRVMFSMLITRVTLQQVPSEVHGDEPHAGCSSQFCYRAYNG